MEETKKTNTAGMQETMKEQQRRMLRALTGRKTQLGLADLRLGRGWSTPRAPRVSKSDVHREDSWGLEEYQAQKAL